MELPDGTNAKVVGRPGESEQVLACVGGTCFIQGIDHSGEDRFWTVSPCACTYIVSCVTLLCSGTPCAIDRVEPLNENTLK